MYDHIRQELNIDTYVSFSGQHAVVKGKTIHEQPVDAKSITELHYEAIEHNFPMVFMNDTLMRSTVPDHPHVIESLARLQFPYPEVDQQFPLEQTVFQALLFCEPEQTHLKERHSNFNFLRWHDFAIDILPKGGSKAIGVNKVMEALNLDHKNSFAIGDGMNDIEMLQEVGTGIAMGNSREPLKEIADLITDSVDNDGFMKALKTVELI